MHLRHSMYTIGEKPSKWGPRAQVEAEGQRQGAHVLHVKKGAAKRLGGRGDRPSANGGGRAGTKAQRFALPIQCKGNAESPAPSSKENHGMLQKAARPLAETPSQSPTQVSGVLCNVREVFCGGDATCDVM